MKTNLISKKTVATVLALTVLSAATLQPKRADAAIMSTAIPSLVVDSVVNGLLGLSVSAFVVGAFMDTGRNNVTAHALDVAWGSLMVAIILDDSGQQKVTFKPIDDKFAAQAGITSEEQESYNQELDVIQATFEDISAQVTPMQDSERTAAARKLWNDYRAVMSPASFSALQKATAQMAR